MRKYVGLVAVDLYLFAAGFLGLSLVEKTPYILIKFTENGNPPDVRLPELGRRGRRMKERPNGQTDYGESDRCLAGG